MHNKDCEPPGFVHSLRDTSRNWSSLHLEISLFAVLLFLKSILEGPQATPI